MPSMRISIGHSPPRGRFSLPVLLALIPIAWLSVLTLFAALCRAASYGDVEYTFNEQA
jgi:hypothetical protein